MDATTAAFVDRLTAIVGKKHIAIDAKQTERYRKGWRSGVGDALAVVFPGTLLEQWRVLLACVDANKIVITQAANTGLTEGSTPSGDYDRDVVMINTLRLDKIHLLRGGAQIVSLPGATLYALENILRPLGREPHSVIGSSTIGASIVGGVCNNSGGSLVQRGPAYTELAVYAQIRADGALTLINHLGVDLGETPEEILTRLEAGDFKDGDIRDDAGHASDKGYDARVRDVDADTPSRYNADPNGLFETSGCAGKLMVFAVRLDTFAANKDARVYYIGTNTPTDLTKIRRRVLREGAELPISGEYMHRDIFDLSRTHGKDTLLLIHWLGTKHLPRFFDLKGKIDARLNALPLLPNNLIDRALQLLSRLAPEALPKRLRDFRDQFEHHLIIKVGGAMAAQVEAIVEETVGAEGWFRCTPIEAKKASLHRFAAAGAAPRYHAVNPGKAEDVIVLDIALRRNDADWLETLPADVEKDLVSSLRYGHFFCHVFHHDYIVRKGADPKAIKAKMLALLDERGAEYPAEHNVGHLYPAKPALAAFYEELDPTNSFNPGIGKTSKQQRRPTAAATRPAA